MERDYESRTQSLQKLHADEAARQKIEVEKAQAELQKIATEKDFLENDLAEGTKQIRSLQRAIKKGAEKVADKENQPNTPKKNKALPIRDGFDDDEVQPLSPSKLVLRSKASTPKGGTKRKRKPTGDSPAKALDLTELRGDGSFETAAQAKDTVPPAISQTTKRPDQRFEVSRSAKFERIG